MVEVGHTEGQEGMTRVVVTGEVEDMVGFAGIEVQEGGVDVVEWEEHIGQGLGWVEHSIRGLDREAGMGSPCCGQYSENHKIRRELLAVASCMICKLEYCKARYLARRMLLDWEWRELRRRLAALRMKSVTTKCVLVVGTFAGSLGWPRNGHR